MESYGPERFDLGKSTKPSGCSSNHVDQWFSIFLTPRLSTTVFKRNKWIFQSFVIYWIWIKDKFVCMHVCMFLFIYLFIHAYIHRLHTHIPNTYFRARHNYFIKYSSSRNHTFKIMLPHISNMFFFLCVCVCVCILLGILVLQSVMTYFNAQFVSF